MASIYDMDKKTSFPKRLIRGAKAWKQLVKPALRNRIRILNALQAGYYSEKAKNQVAHPINLIDRGLSILVPYLVMTNPKILIRTEYKELRPFAKTSELAFNHLMAEIKFAQRTLRPAVRDALMGLGIVKTGVMKASEVELFGYTHSVGEVYSDPVDFVDYIGDPTARVFSDFEFEGNYYKIPVEVARDLFPKFADILNPTYSLASEDRQHSPEKLAKDNSDVESYESLRELVELADFWIPDEGVILTIEPNTGKILKTRSAEAPEEGPYDKLYFKEFPGTPIPIPPVWYWMDLDAAINVIVNKMRIQAASQKAVLAYEGDAVDDAERLASAADREAIKVSNADGIKTIEWPGVDPNQYNWIQYLEHQYSMQGNNLYTLGGRNAQAETLGQEQMLMANASRAIDDMYQMVYDFTANVARKVCWNFWTDPLKSIALSKRIEGVGDVEVIFDKAAQDGEFWEGLLSQWILPTAQIAAQQGAMLNVPKATKQLARLAGIGELDDFYEAAVPSNDIALNPYTPQQGKIKEHGVQDGQTGSNPNSTEANSRQALQRLGEQL